MLKVCHPAVALSVGWKPVILVLLETLFLAGLYFGLLRLMAAQG